MGKVQEQHERAVGDALIAQINRKQKKRYVFNRRRDRGPDLIYWDGNSKIGIEVVTCYYDNNDARFKCFEGRDEQ